MTDIDHEVLVEVFQQQLDAQRYRHLRDFFAVNAEDDRKEFANLAALTGDAFDAAIDKSMRGVL